MDRVFRAATYLMITVILAAAVLCAPTIYRGWQMYEAAVEAEPVSQKVAELRSDEDYVELDQIAEEFRNGVIRSEDKRFRFHFGMDPLSVLRAVKNDILAGSFVEGGSTITQQLAKNVYFTQEKRMARKAAEMFAALDIEKHYSKQEIFEMYVNTIYFGNGCYGVAEAAEGYFKTDAASLTDAQAVVLAGLPQAPSVYASSPALAHKRARVVLQRMVDCHKLTQDAAAQLSAETDVIPFITRSIA